MKRFIIVFAAAVLFLQSYASASPQWLMYHTSDKAREMIPCRSQYLQPKDDVPQGIKLPKLKSSDNLFFSWETGIAPKGSRIIVLDKKHKYGTYDILYIDSDDDGQLDDETPVEGVQTSSYYTEFGKTAVYFEGEDGPVTYHLNFRYYSYNENNQYLQAYPGCWYEGVIEVAGQKTLCRVVDYNGNGAFNDKDMNFTGDRIQLGPDDNRQAYFVGNYIEIDDRPYRLEIAKDGACIDLQAADNLAYGQVELPETIEKFSAGGLEGLFERQVKNAKIKLPVGRYRIYSWSMSRKDKNNDQWVMTGNNFSKSSEFLVEENKPVKLDIGEPVFSRVKSRGNNERDLYFNQNLTGKLGERISLTCKGETPAAPKVRITDRTGKYDRTFSLEYG